MLSTQILLENYGKTPILEINKFCNKSNITNTVYAKLECMNPGGSAKDRVALSMITDAEEKGLIKEGAVIIEPTSGNTGIGLASVCASKGYKVILTMPENMSIERQKLLKAYGAEIVLTKAELGMSGAIEEAKRIVNNTKNSFLAGQFDNEANPNAHKLTTGPEIWNDTDGDIDVLVCTVGTGGTLTGTGEYLKSKNKNIKVIAVEPLSSNVLSGGKPGAHKIQGIGAGFVPKILNTNIYDEIIAISNEDAFKFSRLFAKAEGITVGISSGAALCAVAEISKKEEYKNKKIVVILPDTGERYISTELFQ